MTDVSVRTKRQIWARQTHKRGPRAELSKHVDARRTFLHGTLSHKAEKPRAGRRDVEAPAVKSGVGDPEEGPQLQVSARSQGPQGFYEGSAAPPIGVWQGTGSPRVGSPGVRLSPQRQPFSIPFPHWASSRVSPEQRLSGYR